MMQLLIPLGLLGLIGILVLILIYVIKPNYQTHHISTTFVWKLSLKYRKKRLPTSKIRNIILFICQLLILALIALLLAQPAIVHTNVTGETDIVAIIDSSASMNAGIGEDTRFRRAVEEVEALSERTIQGGGYMTVIIADAQPYFLARRVSVKDEYLLSDQFDAIARNDIICSYGSSDMDAAIDLSEDILADNPSAEIYLYTDKEYLSSSKVQVVSENIVEDDEWNAAVLSVTAENVDGYYVVSVDVACYWKNKTDNGNNRIKDFKDVEVTLEVSGADAWDSTMAGRTVSVKHSIRCEDDTVMTLIFSRESGVPAENVEYCPLTEEAGTLFYAYQTLHVYLNEDDDFQADNDYYVYGGQKELVKVTYASSDPNPFFTSVLDSMKDLFNDRWQLDVAEVPKGQDFPTSGYDLYIYEHSMPDILPTDGVVILMDPDHAPAGSGLRVRGARNNQKLVACDTIVAHPVTRYLVPENIQVSRYTVLDFDADYEALLSISADPLLLVQNSGSSKIAVLPFSVHYSNLVLQIEWPILIYNLFDYFLPSTTDRTTYEVNEEIVLNARGPKVTYSDTEDPIEEFPYTLRFAVPGTYTLQQELYFTTKDDVNVNVFVKTPMAESNIWTVEESLRDPYKTEATGNAYDDLLVYFAAALVALLFLEWILHSKEGR